MSLLVLPSFSFRHSVVPLAELSAVVGDLCSVMVDALWLCMTLALLQPVSTCVAAYCPGVDVYHYNVLHGELQTVAVTARLIHIE